MHSDNEMVNLRSVIETLLYMVDEDSDGVEEVMQLPTIELVRCKECKHRPIKEDPNGENHGFNLIEPNGGDERCPCLVSDGWYSWMPNDNFYCGFAEREGE